MRAGSEALGSRRQKAGARGVATATPSAIRHSPSALLAVRVTQHYRASPARVFDAWLDPDTAARWLFASALRPAARVSIDARAGGSFCFVERRGGADIEHAGEYLEISRPRRLVFTLSERANAHTRVSVEIVPVKSGAELTVVHESLPREQADHTEGRWSGMLYGLGILLKIR